jgi:hypothetical protein
VIRPLASASAAMAVLLLAVSACGPGPASPSSTATAASGAPSPSTAPAASAASPTTAPPTTAPQSSTATLPPSELGVDEDESLLAVLPQAIDGTPVQLEHLAFEEARTQPDFAASIGSAVFFVVPGPDDLVSGLVARPRDGVDTDAWYRDWRETYDEGACAQADGVSGRAEAVLDGRPVSITTCGGGMRVYHVWVREQGVVVSLIALGDSRWGERLMASLRP